MFYSWPCHFSHGIDTPGEQKMDHVALWPLTILATSTEMTKTKWSWVLEFPISKKLRNMDRTKKVGKEQDSLVVLVDFSQTARAEEQRFLTITRFSILASS